VSPGLAITYSALANLEPRNDGQLLAFDQIIPGATLLAYAKADHWQVALPLNQAPVYVRSVVKDNHFPREVLLEAVILYVAEALRDGAP